MSPGSAAPILRLSVPPRSEAISTVRSFAFAIGHQAGLGQETTEDLKLALSEIAADGIEGGGSEIVISVVERPGAIDISVDMPNAGPSGSDGAIDRIQVVRALFPTVRIERRPGTVVTTFSLERV
jgi:hypothetical protein